MSPSTHGHLPTYHIRITEDGHAIVGCSSLTVQLESSYIVDDTAITRAFGSMLTPELADLIDIALAVYVSDRVSRRRPRHADRNLLNWTRTFELTIPVRNVRRWQDGELCFQLRELLWFLTEDDWRIHFIERRRGHHLAEYQRSLFPMPPGAPVTAALFSGGLDSLAGLYCELAMHPQGSIVLLSVSTNSRVKAKQQLLSRSMREQFGRDIIPVNVPLTLWRGQRRYHDDEPSQRSRGLLFGVLGAVTALMAGANSIASFENGIGAINLPFTPAQIGTQNTRSAHPAALKQLGSFVAEATGQEFTFRAPFLYTTKAELCMRAVESGLGVDVRDTVSCDGFPRRLPGKPQCGVCTSCLLRRQALYGAGLSSLDAAEQYAIDVVSSDRRIPNDKLRPLRMMVAQVDSLHRAVTSANPWAELVRQYPELWEVAVNLQSQGQDPESVKRGLMGIYSRYCAEWELFPVMGVRAELGAVS